ncbi:hypothetical protein X777_05268, partial [Ooceraea biroi]
SAVVICHRNSSDFSACLKRGMQDVWPRFIQGFTEIDFPRLEPLKNEHFQLSYNSGSINVDITIINTTTVGFAKTRILDVRPHFFDDGFQIEIDIHVPKLYTEGILKVKGNIGPLGLTINQGPFNLTITNIRVTCNMIGPVINDRWVVEHFYVNPQIGTMKVYFELFESKEINDLAVQFMNEYWPTYYRAVSSTVLDKIDEWLSELANRFSSRIPFSDAVPT